MSTGRPEIDVDKIVQTIREEVRRHTAGASLAPPRPLVESPLNQIPADLVRRLQGLTLTLETRASKLGTPTSEVMTLRGRLALRLMRFMSRALWWYSYHLQNFASAIVHLLREQTKTLEAFARSGQLLQNAHAASEQKIVASEQKIGEAAAMIVRLDQEFRAAQREREMLRQQAVRADLAYARVEELGTGHEVFKQQAAAELAELKSGNAGLLADLRRVERLLEDHLQAQQRPKLAQLYESFEDVFRGSREEIKTRQAIYLPLLREHRIGSSAMPILDLGCGRGEWLELLRENTMESVGVDSNHLMVSRCTALEFSVVHEDAETYLRSLPTSALGAVTAFHLVEHLPFEGVLRILAEAIRVLKPGGLLIFETPNPENIQVGSHTFYLDPTHVRPLPPGMLSFFVESSGFRDVQTRMLHPYVDSAKLPGESKFDHYFYGPQDYAVIGKAG